MRMVEARAEAVLGFLDEKNGPSNIRPMSGLCSTDPGYLTATKAIYLYQSGVFTRFVVIFGENGAFLEKHKSARSIYGL